MGALSQGLGFGSAGTAAQSSMGLGTAGVGLNAASAFLSGIGQMQQMQYRAGVAQNNAAIERQNASATLTAGQVEESNLKLHTGLLMGAQRAAQGASGVDVNVGSPVGVRESMATVGALDAAMMHYNAARAAFGQQMQAANYDAQAELDQRAGVGSALQGTAKAAGSVLSGITALSSRWENYKLSGAK